MALLKMTGSRQNRYSLRKYNQLVLYKLVLVRFWHQALDNAVTDKSRGLGMAALFLAAALDASFLPFPITTLFVVLSLYEPSYIPRYAVFAVTGTITGAITGYLAGRYLWVTSGGEYTGLATFFYKVIPGFSEEGYCRVRDIYHKWDQGIIILASATALPFGIISVSSGVFRMPLYIFIITVFIAQTAKYIIAALLVDRYGGYFLRFLRFNWRPWLISGAILLAIIAFISKASGH